MPRRGGRYAMKAPTQQDLSEDEDVRAAVFAMGKTLRQVATELGVDTMRARAMVTAGRQKIHAAAPGPVGFTAVDTLAELLKFAKSPGAPQRAQTLGARLEKCRAELEELHGRYKASAELRERLAKLSDQERELHALMAATRRQIRTLERAANPGRPGSVVVDDTEGTDGDSDAD